MDAVIVTSPAVIAPVALGPPAPAFARQEHRGPVVVAVHAGSQRLDDVVARARERSLELGRELVFVTVTTRSATYNDAFTIRMRLGRYAIPIRLEVVSVDVEGCSRSERAARIADALISEGRRLGAQSIVAGRDHHDAASPHGVAGRLAAWR